MLFLLIAISIVLNATALGVFAVLIAQRLVQAKATAKAEKVGRYLKQAFTSMMFGDELLTEEVVAKLRQHPILTAHILMGLFDHIRGSEIEHLKEALIATDFHRVLAPALDSQKGDKRSEIAEALVCLGPAGVEEVRKRFDRSNSDTNSTLIMALSGAPNGTDGYELLQHFTSLGHLSALMFQAALERFCALEGPRPIIALLDDPRAEGLFRAAILSALKDQALPSMTAVFVFECSNVAPAVRAAALRVLTNVATPVIAPVLRMMTLDPIPEVRAAAATALCAADGNKTAPILEGLLSDEQWVVRSAAAQALQRCGEQGRLRLQAAAERGKGNDAAQLFLALGASA
jgi:hypothetical protein